MHPFVEFNIRAQWRNRRETATEGAERLVRLLRELPMVHPALNSWFVERSKGTRWFERLGSMPPTHAELEAALLRGIPRDAIFGKSPPEDGFTIKAWNGKYLGLGRSWAEFRTTIGAYDAKRRGINRFEFHFVDKISSRDPLFLPEVVKQLIKLVVDTMEPDCLDVFPVEWLSSVSEKGCPAGGWMSYVRDISLWDYPIDIYTDEAFREEGILAIVSRKIFSMKDANCRRLALELNESLAEVRQWMMSPVVEACPFAGPVRTDLDELLDRSA